MSVCKVYEWRASVDRYPVLIEPGNPDAGVKIVNARGQTFALLSRDEFVYVHGQKAWEALVANG